MRFFLLGCIVVIGSVSLAQEQITIRVAPQFESNLLSLGSKQYMSVVEDSVTVTTFKYYMSNVQLLLDDSLVEHLSTKHFLINAEKPESMIITETRKTTKKYNQIRFEVGIDSTTSTSGVYGGALDPTSGMYWTWQSGYINFKLEGKSDKLETRKNKFNYHLGGYASPYRLLQTIELPVTNDTNEVVINVNVSGFLAYALEQDIHTVMSPSEKARTLANNLPNLFTLK